MVGMDPTKVGFSDTAAAVSSRVMSMVYRSSFLSSEDSTACMRVRASSQKSSPPEGSYDKT